MHAFNNENVNRIYLLIANIICSTIGNLWTSGIKDILDFMAQHLKQII